MKDTITGTVKFIHPNGYGFVKTEDGDVFIHVKGFLKPEVVEMPHQPMVAFPTDEIEPKDIEKGMAVDMEIEEGPKGKAAKYWCFTQYRLRAEKEVAETPFYRLMAREIVTGQPYGDPTRRCWVSDQHLVRGWDWQGYAYQLKDFQPRADVEYQAYVRVGDGWEKCECPLERYNGGPLFDLPIDWKRTV